jgi:hypothetical protein
LALLDEKKRVETGSEGDDSANWANEEFEGIAIGDVRLDKRLRKLFDRLSKNPEAFINQACEDWKDTKAAYRFFDNERVTEEKILSGHRQRALARMRAHPIVLAVQDTTELDYTSRPTVKGLGPIGNHKAGAHGLRVHTTLAVTPEGLPLGIINKEIEARKDKRSHLSAKQKRQQHKKMAILDKESMRWIRSLEKTVEYSRTLKAGEGEQTPLVVTITDREGDIFELFLVAQQKEAAYLVRANQDRLVKGHEQRQLWELMEAAEPSGCFTATVSNRKAKQVKGGAVKGATRKAKLEVTYIEEVVLKPTKRKVEFRIEGWGEVKLSAIHVREVDSDQEVENQIEWMLLTNVPVRTYSEAIEKVAWYCQRWQIETYHKIMKSGCRVEKCQLATGKRLGKYIVLMSVVAWRLFWMTWLQRVAEPNTPCTVALAAHEWKALCAKRHRTNDETEFKAPTLQEAVRWIASLGGFLGRKGDGEPGVTVIWRGWRRLNDLADMWLINHPEPTYG